MADSVGLEDQKQFYSTNATTPKEFERAKRIHWQGTEKCLRCCG